MKELLKKVEKFAEQAHGDQMRKYAQERYIAHPIRVMNLCQNYVQDLCILSAALLHDVLEDTDTRKHEILEFLESVLERFEAKRTLDLVIELTDVYTKSAYPHLNRDQRKRKEADRIASVSSAAQTIKYADVIDNSQDIVEFDADFAPKFLKEYQNLLSLTKKGNNELYQLASMTVSQGLKKLEKS
ncbi:hypothetical protein GCM10009119_38100 [Algoriphagus jejuensis]|uniref:HD/PDEase domain-containing protein n=1 Tax=Algoriphagus jejuensis TaxID=419934 RepID=A0ABN1N528_9BACT